ncbi:MAG: hypothetical protein KIS66_15850 [Fimbriimonadaceae bacterium]|nr:hypothetical protein [Fimbriimonadaceae bacterium]
MLYTLLLSLTILGADFQEDPRLDRAGEAAKRFLDEAHLSKPPSRADVKKLGTSSLLIVSVGDYLFRIFLETGEILSVSNGGHITSRIRNLEVREPSFIRTAAELEPKLRAMLARLGVPRAWKTDALSLRYDESKDEGDMQDRCGVARIVVSERTGELPFHGFDNRAELESDPVTGDLLRFFIHRRCRAVPGVQRIEAARAKEIAVAEYAGNRSHIPYAPETPLPKTPELGYCPSQEHQRKPMAEWRDLPSLLSWKVPFDDEINAYVVVNAEDGSILWRSWLNLSKPPTIGN